MHQKLDFDIIMLALAKWDGPYSSTAYSLAKALSKHTRVFYVDNPITWKYYFAKKDTLEIQRRKDALLKGKKIFTSPDQEYPNLIAVTPRLIFPNNWMSKGKLYEMTRRYNDRIVAESLNTAIKEHQIRKYVLINSFNPFFGKYFNLDQKPVLSVYQSVDDISQSPYINKHGVWLEKEAITAADFSITTSSELRRTSSAYSDQVFLLPNAANVALFQKAATDDLRMPPEIEKLPRDKKIITYTGNICHRLDYELLVSVARRHSDKILLMVGPFANENYRTAGLDKLPNVVFAGKKRIDELPAYLKYSDCCIIPFLRNQLTRSIYPLKINEYLSAGKPVISTNFSEDIMSFKDLIYASDTVEEFVNNIDKAIFENSRDLEEKRIAMSRPNNWENRADQLIGYIQSFLPERASRPTKAVIA